MMSQATKVCEKCSRPITPDDIVQRKAGLVQGVLLCPSCVEMKRRVALQARAGAAQSQSAPAAQASTATNPPLQVTASKAPAEDEADELISLVSDDEMPGSKSQIHSFADGSTLGGAHHEANLKRSIGGPRDAATRVRTFHCKLTDAGVANLDDIMNEWLDNHSDIYIKNVTSSIGVFEGKVKEPHLFICVFY